MNDPIHPMIYVTSLEEIFSGAGLVALTLIIHGFGMIWTVRIDNAFKRRFRGEQSFIAGMSGLVLASWMLVFVHIVEVTTWASFFQWKQCFPNFSTANYFALNEYTTLGSALRLPQSLRLLEGMIAMAGLLAFAWSTGVLLTLAREFQTQQLLRLDHRRNASGAPAAPDPAVRGGGAEPN